VCTRALRGWERNAERLPPGYRLDTTDAATWALRRPDGTVVSYFCVWSVTREAVERAAREDHRIKGRSVKSSSLALFTESSGRGVPRSWGSRGS
jgi:hypothetical protein